MRIPLLGLILAAISAPTAVCAGGKVHSLEIRILSTMLTSETGVGEWGFSALVIADGHRILFDTGRLPDTVLHNIRDLKIDLTNVPDVILSHNHPDHTGGLLTLRKELAKSNPAALGRAYVAPGIFTNRILTDGTTYDRMAGVRREYEASGGKIVETSEPTQLYPGVWLTGPVARKFPERNWFPGPRLRLADGTLVEDNVPEDQALIFDTDKGFVVLTGCGHAGVVNICDYARARIRNAPIHALIGGLHLVGAKDETLDWTAGKLKEFGLENLLGLHCTGIEPLFRLRELSGLTRKTAAVGAVGASFLLDKGFDLGEISR